MKKSELKKHIEILKFNFNVAFNENRELRAALRLLTEANSNLDNGSLQEENLRQKLIIQNYNQVVDDWDKECKTLRVRCTEYSKHIQHLENRELELLAEIKDFKAEQIPTLTRQCNDEDGPEMSELPGMPEEKNYDFPF